MGPAVGKGKGLDTWPSDQRPSGALRSHKWQLIDMTWHVCALRSYPLQRTDSAASRDTRPSQCSSH